MKLLLPSIRVMSLFNSPEFEGIGRRLAFASGRGLALEFELPHRSSLRVLGPKPILRLTRALPTRSASAMGIWVERPAM